jgi:hypothetical protein
MDEDLAEELESEKRIKRADETMRRRKVLELALQAVATCPDFFSKSATNTDRTVGAMVVREAKTIYGYLYPEEKQ